jgi:hypothetical protein
MPSPRTTTSSYSLVRLNATRHVPILRAKLLIKTATENIYTRHRQNTDELAVVGPVGVVKDGKVYLNKHLDFTISQNAKNVISVHFSFHSAHFPPFCRLVLPSARFILAQILPLYAIFFPHSILAVIIRRHNYPSSKFARITSVNQTSTQSFPSRFR